MLFIEKKLKLAIERTTSIPFDGVPFDKDKYLKETSRLKILKKYLHKYLFLFLNKQFSLQTKFIPPNTKCLWLYTGKRNIGDAIMDLSGRSLLKDHRVHVDLLTLPNLKEVFQEDDIFLNVYDNISDVENEQYDFIILSEFNHPSMRLKVRHFPKIKFACLFGFFYGPDRNQTLFSHHAINQVFQLGFDKIKLSKIAKPYLNANINNQKIESISKPYIALSIGGIDPDRSYQHWVEFLHLIDSEKCHLERNNLSIALLGSGNGKDMANQILRESFNNISIHNFVGKLSILESRELISQAKIFIACDGGLMHAGHSTGTPSISLFRNQEPPEFRLTESCHSTPIQSTGDVNGIPPHDIYKAYLDLMDNKPHE
jgi:ADP-heptose:LPS heptosyltransferase